MAPGNGEGFSVAEKQANADRYVDENIEQQVILGRYESTYLEIGIDQPQRECHPNENSSRPDGEKSPLECAVGEFGLVMERVNNGDVAFHGYQNQVKTAYHWRHFQQGREGRDDHVEAAWIVEHVDDEEKRTVPELNNGVHDVGHELAGQDEIGLGPESGRHPDRDERKAVAAQVEYLQDEENGSPYNDWICWQRTSHRAACSNFCRSDVHGAGVDIWRV